jgi:hypothetical protein
VRDRFFKGPWNGHKPIAVSDMTMAQLDEAQADLHNVIAAGDCSHEQLNDRIEIERIIRARGLR